jgi:putative transposase
MGSFTQTLYQIVFSTRLRKKCMIKEHRDQLYRYMYGVLKNKNCHTFKINGVEDHLHIITSIHPTIALASLVKLIKVSSCGFIKQKKLFQNFDGWQGGYGGFTYAYKDRFNLINYVERQEEHHRKKEFIVELKDLYIEHEIEFDERYLL